MWTPLLGQPLFRWHAPDGYPDFSAAWVNNLLPRWNFSLALMTGQLRGVEVPLADLLERHHISQTSEALNLFASFILGQPLDQVSMTLFANYVGNAPLSRHRTHQRLKESIALMLASPRFQWT